MANPEVGSNIIFDLHHENCRRFDGMDQPLTEK